MDRSICYAFAGFCCTLSVVPLAKGASCEPGSPAHKSAQQRLEELDARIQALSDAAGVDAVRQELDQLLGSPCFALSVENRRRGNTKSPLAFKTWWADGGGEWVRSYLPHKPGEAASVVLPPDVRRSLAREDQPGSPLSFLLCPYPSAPSVADTACGAETRGWIERANSILGAEPPHWLALPSMPKSDLCERFSRGPNRSYRQFRTCLEEERPLTAAMPLGSFRAPQRGWLAIRGRRGHYDFCDEIRFYHLATGSAHIAKSCSRLVLGKNGTVHNEKTHSQASLTVQSGKVLIDNLREATLLMLLAQYIERRVQTRAWRVDLPSYLSPSWPAEAFSFAAKGGGTWATSSQTLLHFSLSVSEQGAASQQERGDVKLEGELPWPNSSDAGMSYAASLLRVAEASFVDGDATPLPEAFLTPESAIRGVTKEPGSERRPGVYSELIDALRRRATEARTHSK